MQRRNINTIKYNKNKESIMMHDSHFMHHSQEKEYGYKNIKK